MAKEDSGTDVAPIRYAAAAGEKPVFQGGKRLTVWRKLSETDNFAACCCPTTRETKLRLADLKRRRIENVLPLKLGGFASGNGFVTHPAHELFFNGRPMRLARGPNEGFLQVKDIEVKDG